jgi:RimJ/RimL family protein N-acetyltransferase
MSTRDELTAIWPLYGLGLTTPRLELRLPTETDLIELAGVARGGVQPPGTRPFHAPWLCEPSPRVERTLLRTVLGEIANWESEDWTLGLAVCHEGSAIGMQHIFAKRFGLTRCFGTGCWLGLAHQGRGFGTEMGQAILTLGFEGLTAREAYIGAWADNVASIRVMEKLGYLPNGQYYQPSGDTVRRDVRMRLPRERWLAMPRAPVQITGLGPCLELFGVTDGTSAGDTPRMSVSTNS